MNRHTARHFFILGAAKAGTTSVHAWLDQHPAVRMSDPKEPFFFEAEFEKGPDFYHARYFHAPETPQWLGDARHRNLYFPYIPARIHALFPDARLIAVLRNPVDRAYAHWWHWYRLGREALSFREAVAADAARIVAGQGVSTPAEIADYARTLDPDGMGPYRTYLDSGYYAEQLERYLALFPREQLLVIWFEELVAEPRRILADTCSFLGIDPVPVAGMDFAARNSSGRLRWRRARDKILARLATQLRTEPLSVLTRAGRKKLFERPPLEPDMRAWLQQHYQPHNARLRKLLGVELARWD